jgi:predicted RNA polymerase sigma factor
VSIHALPIRRVSGAAPRTRRLALCEDPLRLGRIPAERAPSEPEVHGLVALMEIQASRTRARVSASGELILILEQNRALWDPNFSFTTASPLSLDPRA